MRPSDYADLKDDYLELARKVQSAVADLRALSGPAARIADRLEAAVDKAAADYLRRDDADDAIARYAIPEAEDAYPIVEKALASFDPREVDAALATLPDGTLLKVDASDDFFDIERHDRLGSRDYEVGHLVVVRQAEDGLRFVRISPSFAHGFELSSCDLFRDVFSVGGREEIGAAASLEEAIAMARGHRFGPSGPRPW